MKNTENVIADDTSKKGIASDLKVIGFSVLIVVAFFVIIRLFVSNTQELTDFSKNLTDRYIK